MTRRSDEEKTSERARAHAALLSACVLSAGMLLTLPALAGAQATHAHAVAAPLVVGSPDSEDVRALPVDARPALSQRIGPVFSWLEHEPQSIAVLGHECPEGWTVRKTADGKKKLYVPLGLLVDETGAPRTSYTLLVACVRP